eukprot:2650882-Pyramimonas_sp.AAC.1
MDIGEEIDHDQHPPSNDVQPSEAREPASGVTVMNRWRLAARLLTPLWPSLTVSLPSQIAYLRYVSTCDVVLLLVAKQTTTKPTWCLVHLSPQLEYHTTAPLGVRCTDGVTAMGHGDPSHTLMGQAMNPACLRSDDVAKRSCSSTRAPGYHVG